MVGFLFSMTFLSNALWTEFLLARKKSADVPFFRENALPWFLGFLILYHININFFNIHRRGLNVKEWLHKTLPGPAEIASKMPSDLEQGDTKSEKDTFGEQLTLHLHKDKFSNTL